MKRTMWVLFFASRLEMSEKEKRDKKKKGRKEIGIPRSHVPIYEWILYPHFLGLWSPNIKLESPCPCFNPVQISGPYC